jgi:flagellar M-ring protein FliF
MVRMARGRSLGEGQVAAIANLVAGSVPGLGIDAVRIVDQHGKLLTEARDPNAASLDMQNRLESELTAKVGELLAPIFGPEAFSAQVRVELDMSEVTSARESYDKDGAVRRESVQQSQGSAGQLAGGVPGVVANTPPDPATARAGAPQGTAGAQAASLSSENNATRTFELGREVSVSSMGPGAVKHISAAVALDQSVLAKSGAADIKRVEQLVSAAIGARLDRGDTVAVIARPFQKAEPETIAFYETSWFGMALRTGLSVLGVLLVLLLAVRPALKALRNRGASREAQQIDLVLPSFGGAGPQQLAYDRAALDAQVEAAQRIARENPDDAVLALRRLLAEPAPAREAA